MKYDQYGQVHTDVNELCELLYANPSVDIAQFVVDDPTQYNDSVKSLYGEMSLLEQYHAIDSSIEDFDKNKQQDWFMPASYQELDIASWLLDKCKTQEELQRVGIELILLKKQRFHSNALSVLNFRFTCWSPLMRPKKFCIRTIQDK